MRKKNISLKSKLLLYKSLQNLKPEHLQHVIKHLNDKSIDDICECVYNVIFTDLKLPQKTKSKLKRNLHKHCCKSNLKIISSKKYSNTKRRQALSQEGRGLGFILSSIIPLLTNLFT